MNKANLSEFLRDISLHTEYRFLEQGKDDNELQKIAEKRGISLPAKDLAIFKGKYAFTDRTNLNGCSLPKAEVEKSLKTLFGKAIDFDHIRERIVGFWLDAVLEGDTIYAYGAFFKTNLADDYTLVKELMDKKNLMISFEAYGNREFKNDTTYDLTDIEWAGGALLINTKPAFPGAAVLEMSNKRVLEFANVMTEPKEYIKAKEDKKLEKARMYTSDMETIMRLTNEIECPMCKCQGCVDINEIDFKDNEIEATCWMCDCNMNVSLTPSTKITLPDDMANSSRKIKSITKKEENSMAEKKLEASSEETVIKTEGDGAVETTEEVVVIEEATEELIKEAEAEVVVADAKSVVPTGTKPVVDNKQKLADAPAPTNDNVDALVKILQKEVDAYKMKVVTARDEGKVIGTRRAFLGDFAKDMTDDDVLDATKYENACLKKKVAELEGKKTVTVASTETTETASTTPLEIGSKDKSQSDEVSTLAKNVRKRAFGL